MSRAGDQTLPAQSDPVAYTADSIVVLPGLESVRRHPAMFVGSVSSQGLHRLVFELVDNAVDEAEAGFCRRIEVRLYEDGSCAVIDDGRGLPVDEHSVVRRPACEVVFTTLHAGGKFDEGVYMNTAGLHGVGAACVNALAEWLKVDVWRDGAHFRLSFARGQVESELTRHGTSTRRGTGVRFKPDDSIFDTVEFDAETLRARLQEIAFLHPRLTICFADERAGTEEELRYDTGVCGFLQHRNEDLAKVHPTPFVVRHASDGLAFDLAFQWTEGYAEHIWSFVNTVRTEQGGEHVEGLRAALNTAINAFATRAGMLDALAGETIAPMDILEGFTAVLDIRMRRPRFDGQTKMRLDNVDIKPLVQRAVRAALDDAFQRDSQLGRSVVQRALDATRARLAARLASRTARLEKRELKVDYEVYKRQFGIRSKNWHSSCSWLTDKGLLKTHASLCGVAPTARVLDVCCGSGVVGASFRDQVGEIIGLDITPEMVALSSERLDHVDQGTVYNIPHPPESFDLVVNREVLHLLPQPEKPVGEIYRVLRPGGQFIVGQIVPFADEDAFWMYRIFKKKQPLLFQMFREQDFRNLIASAGFVDIQMKEYLLWESIDQWIDTHETTPVHRQEIYRLFYDAPPEVRAVHPFEVAGDGSVRDQWRWCVYSAWKPR